MKTRGLPLSFYRRYVVKQESDARKSDTFWNGLWLVLVTSQTNDAEMSVTSELGEEQVDELLETLYRSYTNERMKM